MSKKKIKSNNNFLNIFLVVLILFGIFNIYQLYSTKSAIENQINTQIEKAKPAQISLTIIDINKKDCPKCLNITKVVKLITDSKKTNVTKFVTKNFKDSDIQSKISELKIDKFPALIIEGNINQSNYLVKNIEKITKKINNEVYVFTSIEAPYLNNNGKVIGKVNLIGLYNKDCLDCPNIDLLLEGVNRTNIYLNDIQKVDINNDEGKTITKKYNINKVPTLLFSNELKNYNSIVNNWEKGVGSIESDGTYVLRKINPIYFSVKENRVVGKIKLSILSNPNCKNCFNGSEVYPAIISKLGIVNFNKVLIDTTSKEGKNLTLKYNLEKFPMMIIEGDTDIYPNLKQVWDQVGTIENGKYIFKNVELLQAPYFDVTKGEITPKTK